MESNMKITALIAAAALLGAGATYAQQHDTANTKKLRNAFHKLGEKTRHAFHRAGDKTRQVAHRDRSDDTRAMGASGSDARQHRMEDAYSNWQQKQNRQETNR
jgi:uncharacterized membrane protein